MVATDTAMVVLAGAGAAAWGITVAVRRAVDRAELRRNCKHRLVTDPCDGWNATLRCAHGCGHQEPDREYTARWNQARDDRIHAIVARIDQCPRCGGSE